MRKGFWMSLKYNYKLEIAYDGTDFGGWQVQPNAVTIQQKMEEAASIILRHPVTLIGSGRTDAGVHALGQVAHFKTDLEIDLRRFLLSMNGLLPYTIRLKSVEPVPLDFHSQYSAIGKEYHYHLCLDKVQDPFRRLYSYHVRGAADPRLIVEGAKYFLGTHDFTSFANEAHSGSAARNAVRTVRRLDVIPEEQGVRLEFEADGFLYKMVRNITGILLDLAQGKLEISEISKILRARDRREAGRAAPPHGLFLVKVNY